MQLDQVASKFDIYNGAGRDTAFATVPAQGLAGIDHRLSSTGDALRLPRDA